MGEVHKMKVKACELRSKTSRELTKEVDELRAELGQLSVAKATAAAASKVAKIRGVRKSIARVLTVYNQKLRKEAKEKYQGKKYVPQDLRPKKTRAIRRRLTTAQKTAVVSKVKTKAQNFPQRRYAVKA